MEESLISSAAPPLLLICTKIIKTLHGVRPKLRPAPITMTSITTECFGLHEALARVEQLDSMGRKAVHASPFEKVSRSITAFFYGCSMSLSVIDEYAMELNDGVQIDRLGEAALNQNSDLLKLWKEGDMQELLSQIREYRMRLADLLQAVEAGRAEPEDAHANTKNHASIAGLLSRSRSSFLTGTDSTRSSLRNSILSLDPSPPYALSLYAYSEKAATRSTETLHDETPKPELHPQGDATAPVPAHEQSEETIDEGITDLCSKRASLNARPLSQGEIRNTISGAREKRPPIIFEPYTSGLDQTADWDGADLKPVARNSLEHSPPQLTEAIKLERHAAGGSGQRRDINFSRPLTVSSVNEIPSDEEWSESRGPGRFVVQDGHDEYTTYSDNQPLDLVSRISSHESIALPTKDWRDRHNDLWNLVTTRSGSESYTAHEKDKKDSNLASERLNRSYNAFLEILASFLGSHTQSPSSSELLLTTQQAVKSYKELLSTIEVVLDHNMRRPDSLMDTKDTMYDKIIELVCATGAVYHSVHEEDSIISPLEQGKQLINAATACVRGAGDCVAKTRLVLEQIGDFEIDPELGKDSKDQGFLSPGKLRTAEETIYQLPKVHPLTLRRYANPCLKLKGSQRYKILVAGDDNSGRSALINQFLGRSNDDEDPTNEDFSLVREICYLREIEEQRKAFAANEPPANRRFLREIFGWGRS